MFLEVSPATATIKLEDPYDVTRDPVIRLNDFHETTPLRSFSCFLSFPRSQIILESSTQRTHSLLALASAVFRRQYQKAHSLMVVTFEIESRCYRYSDYG